MAPVCSSLLVVKTPNLITAFFKHLPLNFQNRECNIAHSTFHSYLVQEENLWGLYVVTALNTSYSSYSVSCGAKRNY